MIVLVPALAGALIVGGVIALSVGVRPSPVAERPSRLPRIGGLTRQTRLLLLGGFAALTGVVDIADVEAAAAERFSGQVLQGNCAAAREAYESVLEVAGA